MKTIQHFSTGAVALLLFFIAAVTGCKKEDQHILASMAIPTLTTVYVSGITKSAAVSGGLISSDGGGAIIRRGVCWATHTSPTVDDSKSDNGSATGAFTSPINGLTDMYTYWVRAYAINSAGVAYGNEYQFTVLPVGENYGGGRVAYILQPGDPGYDAHAIHGLIVAPSDAPAYRPGWCEAGRAAVETGTTATALGTGKTSTTSIYAKLGSAAFAVVSCIDLESGGFTDWYLPNKDELNKVYLASSILGGFSGTDYWSSSEINASTVYCQNFGTGKQGGDYKTIDKKVRAIRSF